MLDYGEKADSFVPQMWEGRVLVHSPHLERAKRIVVHVLERLNDRPVWANLTSSKRQILR